MSIRVISKSKTLAAMLTLEARRQGFAEAGEPSILFVDLDTAQRPARPDGTPTVLLTCDPTQAEAMRDDTVLGVLSLPFSVREFGDILHRSGGKFQNTSLRLAGNTLWLEGERISLSATEAALLALLYKHRDRTVTEAELKTVLGEGAERANTLAVYMYRLRRKLCADGMQRIRTVRGEGYRWAEYEKR